MPKLYCLVAIIVLTIVHDAVAQPAVQIYRVRAVCNPCEEEISSDCLCPSRSSPPACILNCDDDDLHPSWRNAYPRLQDALYQIALDNHPNIEIRIERGRLLVVGAGDFAFLCPGPNAQTIAIRGGFNPSNDMQDPPALPGSGSEFVARRRFVRNDSGDRVFEQPGRLLAAVLPPSCDLILDQLVFGAGSALLVEHTTVCPDTPSGDFATKRSRVLADRRGGAVLILGGRRIDLSECEFPGSPRSSCDSQDVRRSFSCDTDPGNANDLPTRVARAGGAVFIGAYRSEDIAPTAVFPLAASVTSTRNGDARPSIVGGQTEIAAIERPLYDGRGGAVFIEVRSRPGESGAGVTVRGMRFPVKDGRNAVEGGALYIDAQDSSVLVENCAFGSRSVGRPSDSTGFPTPKGGAVVVISREATLIKDSIFCGCSAGSLGQPSSENYDEGQPEPTEFGLGGAVYCAWPGDGEPQGSSIMEVQDCEFYDNRAGYRGGAIFARTGSSILRRTGQLRVIGPVEFTVAGGVSRCRIGVDFAANKTLVGGAAYLSVQTGAQIAGCQFYENAANEGGAIRIEPASQGARAKADSALKFIDCVFDRNDALSGAGAAVSVWFPAQQGAAAALYQLTTAFINCVFRTNRAQVREDPCGNPKCELVWKGDRDYGDSLAYPFGGVVKVTAGRAELETSSPSPNVAGILNCTFTSDNDIFLSSPVDGGGGRWIRSALPCVRSIVAADQLLAANSIFWQPVPLESPPEGYADECNPDKVGPIKGRTHSLATAVGRSDGQFTGSVIRRCLIDLNPGETSSGPFAIPFDGEGRLFEIGPPLNTPRSPNPGFQNLGADDISNVYLGCSSPCLNRGDVGYLWASVRTDVTFCGRRFELPCSLDLGAIERQWTADTDELSDFITAFFNGGSCADANGDGFIDPDDLSDTVTMFFSLPVCSDLVPVDCEIPPQGFGRCATTCPVQCP